LTFPRQEATRPIAQDTWTDVRLSDGLYLDFRMFRRFN
jgi:hypothetical protein